MYSHGRYVLYLGFGCTHGQGFLHRNPLTDSIPVGIDSPVRGFLGPMAVPVCQIVHVEMEEMMMDDFVDVEVANTFTMHWSRVDGNVLLVDVQSLSFPCCNFHFYHLQLRYVSS